MNRTGHEMQLDASSKTAEEGPAFLLRGERSNQSRRVLVQYLTEQCQDSLRQEEGDLYDGIIPAASIKYLLSSNLSTFASNPSRAPSAPLLERSHQYEVTAPITFNPPVRTNVSPSPPSTPRFAQQNLSSQGSRGTICDEESDPFSFFPLPEVRLEPASASTLVKESFETIYSVSASPSVEASSNRTLLTSPPPALLHQVCKSHAQTETAVRRVLQLDPESVTRRLPRSRSHFLRRRKKGEFDYPVNIAIRNNASLNVLEILANAGKKVLSEGDGPEWCCALSIALYQRLGTDVVSLLLKSNRSQVRVRDRHMNYPLHVACLCGSSLPTIKLLASRCRRVLQKRNFHGQTPLDIARRSPLCSELVVDYLEKMSFASFEEQAIHLNCSDSNDSGNDSVTQEQVTKHVDSHVLLFE